MLAISVPSNFTTFHAVGSPRAELLAWVKFKVFFTKVAMP